MPGTEASPDSPDLPGAPDPDDHELLRRTAAHDRNAFRKLVERHQTRILTLAYRFLGRWDAAEDVGQEALVRVFQNAGRIRPEAKFTTWLYRVVANLCWEFRRRAARRPPPPPDTDPPDAADPALRDELRQAVRRAVADLPDRQRLALILHRFHGLGQREIAEITGSSVSAVESCLVRAYASLRSRLAGFLDD